VLLQQLLRDHDAVGVEIEAVLAVVEPAVVLVRVLLLLQQIDVARDIEHERALDLVLDQHLLLQRRRHVQEGDIRGVDAVDLGELRETA